MTAVWFPMESSPKNGRPVLLRLKDVLRPNREDLEPCRGVIFVGHHNGILDDGLDIGWQFAAPVGHGGFPDEWFIGWRYLPDDEKLMENEDPWSGFRPTHREAAIFGWFSTFIGKR